MALVGTIRRNKPELPPNLLQTRQRAILSSVFAFTKSHTAVSYVPKRGKNVLLLSTKHREPSMSEAEHQKPTIILDYNSCKGGVDNLDKVVGTYSCRRKSCRWPLTLFYNILDVSAYNAFVLWMAVDPSWNEGKKYKRRAAYQHIRAYQSSSLYPSFQTDGSTQLATTGPAQTRHPRLCPLPPAPPAHGGGPPSCSSSR
ncbi:hypothetical protein SKAU_G00245690 [Synaphobranchus kaupii]|uniref:PiggyBac transposable element-derived protein domain-containing protein n=1 Tax=Synaphobranchus kaupii TaxID=118154 RepID=A0A9Q1F1V1_SYNKA|nr:hypothetical protein SKAU_G00245690 [Synaphobranchus kaupii]